MSDPSERQIEAAGAAIELEAGEAIARIHGELTAPGSEDCLTCGEPIPCARRKALPSARRCISCQTRFERGQP